MLCFSFVFIVVLRINYSFVTFVFYMVWKSRIKGKTFLQIPKDKLNHITMKNHGVSGEKSTLMFEWFGLWWFGIFHTCDFIVIGNWLCYFDSNNSHVNSNVLFFSIALHMDIKMFVSFLFIYFSIYLSMVI